MKAGIYANCMRELSFEAMLDRVSSLGLETVELGCGLESGKSHIDPEVLLQDTGALARTKSALAARRLTVSALSCHGNPLHPQKPVAESSDRMMREAVLLAEQLGLETICCFSGCPGGTAGDDAQNWVTWNWPMDYAEVYRWQWDEVLAPYWKKFAVFARQHGVKKIALELHPGQMVYNPRTLLRLRETCGEEIGVNLDLSHLLWQRMEALPVIRALKGTIYHMHVKDISFNETLVAESGVINTRFFDDNLNRPWNFRVIGYGHDLGWWASVFAELRRCGYDGTASIECEDELMSFGQAIEKAVSNLRQVLIRDDTPEWIERTRKLHSY